MSALKTEFTVTSGSCIMAPAKLPPLLVARLNDAITSELKHVEVKKRFSASASWRSAAHSKSSPARSVRTSGGSASSSASWASAPIDDRSQRAIRLAGGWITLKSVDS